jgi:hypothetical protein
MKTADADIGPVGRNLKPPFLRAPLNWMVISHHVGHVRGNFGVLRVGPQ